jgi:Uma2 family endonuclease
VAVAIRGRFLADDIFKTPDDGKRYEVIDGNLYATTAPDLDHQEPITHLIYLIQSHLNRLPRGTRGKLYTSPVGLILDEHNGLQPDLVYVSAARSSILTRRGIRGVPDLVVEVLSPGTEDVDRGVKMRRYAAAGIVHYWLVGPEPRAVEAYRLDESGEYRLAGTFGPGTIFRPDLFPDLEIPLDELWQ